MLKLLCGGAFLLALTTPAFARIPLPPKQYDRPYHGRLIIVDLSWAEMQRRCGGPTWNCYGYTHGDQGGTCTIYVTSRNYRLIRHEVGHCNGWDANHHGERV